MAVYETTLMPGRFKYGTYHIFSLIGFLMRATYTRTAGSKQEDVAETEQFERALAAFLEKYKQFNKRYNRLEGVPMYKYQDIPAIYEAARTKWRSDQDLFKHKDHIDVIEEVERLFAHQKHK